MPGDLVIDARGASSSRCSFFRYGHPPKGASAHPVGGYQRPELDRIIGDASGGKGASGVNAAGSIAHAASPWDRNGDGALRVTLLGGFALLCGTTAPNPSLNSQRLIAYLALHDRPQSRSHVAGTLWPESTEDRSHASLRSALWRLNGTVPGLVRSIGGALVLNHSIEVDASRMASTARMVMGGFFDSRRVGETKELLAHDLLPEWDDEWVVVDRERLRQLRLHALESLAEQCTRRHRFGDAIEACLLAIGTEPLRESAHRILIEAHLTEGNRASAMQRFELYETLLRAELGLEPSAEVRGLVSRAMALDR
jgi:DNA-binding SARP family transcriptional activator